MSPTLPRRIVFHGKQQVALETFDPGQPGAGELRVRTELSLMSTGTENIVFNQLFEPGTIWASWVKYPFYPGYASVGVVEAVGEGVEGWQPGRRVAFRTGHRSHAVVPATGCFPIPEGLSAEAAVWFALAKITFVGARAADYCLGDSVLIIGAGPIGQMSIRWARAAGAAHIIVVDSAANRMAMATAGGATATITAPITEAREAIVQAMGGEGRLPHLVIDTTGNATVFAAALGLAANRGRLVLLGDTGTPSQQTLTHDVVVRGLTIIGAHDCHTTEEWTDARMMALFFQLAADGRISLEGLNTHFFQPGQCEEAYATANRDRASTMGLVFDWRKG